MSRHISSKSGGSSRGGDRTRRRILGAALRLFSRDGFHGTSIRGLARSVGLTEAAIYYHFPSKRAIVRALYERRGFMAAMEELEHLPGDIPLEHQLAANAAASARLWDENTDFLRVVIVEVLRGDRAAQSAHRELMERWLRGITRLLTRYQRRGEISAEAEVREAAESWVNLTLGAFVDRLLALGRSRAPFLTPELQAQIEATARTFARRLQG